MNRIPDIQNLSPFPPLQDYQYYDVFSAVFKISDLCNLHCTYCYRENALQTHALQDMDLEIIDNMLASILEYKQNLYRKYGWNKTPSLYFIWHGGEPLIVGIDRFQAILSIQEKYRKQGLLIDNCIQTNGTLINDDFLRLFKKEHFRIGVSIDGPREIQDAHRIHKNGKPSFDQTMQGISLLRECDYPWSAISVINTEAIGHEKEIHAFFQEQKPFEVDFTPAFFYETDISLPPKDYSSFMIKLFDIWISEKNPVYEIRFFKDVLYLLGYKEIPDKSSVICELSGKCHRNISVGSNGDIYSCECLNSKPENRIGNILEKSFSEIILDEPFVNMAGNTNLYRSECLDCDVFTICKAGCYNRRLPAEDGNPKLDFYCDARKEIIRHIKDYVVRQ
ncbi:radical SAM/SPASM domain-containing protein [Methanorbis furvi]|uniref:Anaerobic sulfatase-maturating enzyme n=1 Tax=Methanorbis furvi TaxID=3028299 RepID=A0AAE4MAK0_9EURY|nr:Anaerobic sulfatase-maturating enzyme [Methanocorpusculaceae archaeon Ag1]